MGPRAGLVVNCLVTEMGGFLGFEVSYYESGALLVRSNEVGREVNTEKMKCMFVSRQQNITTDKKSLEKCVETTCKM